MKKSQTRWNASTYKADWFDAVAIVNDGNFILDIIDEISLPKRASILEIGIGSGKWSFAFFILGYEVTAMDMMPEILEQAKRNFPNLKIEYVVDKLPNLKSDASKRKYDLVFNEGLLEHILDRDERIASIRAMGNCCKSNGHVCFFVPFMSDEEDEHRYTSKKELHEEITAADLDFCKIDSLIIGTASKETKQFGRNIQMFRALAKKGE